MAIYRNVHLAFWTDNKVEDDFTPEDKYFYLYLLTNPQTNICGCYEVSFNQMTRQTGYNKETILRLMDRFEKIHNVIRYNAETKEILLMNWYKYNWSKSEKTLAGVEKVAKKIKCAEFEEYIDYAIDCIRNDTPMMGYLYPMQASDTDTDTVTVSDTDYVNNTDKDNDGKKSNRNKNKDTIKRIIDYLNKKCDTHYRPTTENTVKNINARLADGYTEDDFYKVIDKKCDEWIGTKMEKYLRPETLFRPANFESYVNQKIKGGEHKQSIAEMITENREMLAEWAREMEEKENDI